MDPQVAWDEMLTAVSERDWEQAEEFAEALLKWLRQGGYPPRTVGHVTIQRNWNQAMGEFGCLMALQYVLVGMILIAAARARRRSLWGPSTID